MRYDLFDNINLYFTNLPNVARYMCRRLSLRSNSIASLYIEIPGNDGMSTMYWAGLLYCTVGPSLSNQKDQQYNQKTPPKSYKTKIKILANPGNR